MNIVETMAEFRPFIHPEDQPHRTAGAASVERITRQVTDVITSPHVYVVSLARTVSDRITLSNRDHHITSLRSDTWIDLVECHAIRRM